MDKRERIEVNGRFLGWVEADFPNVRVHRAFFKPGTRAVFYAILPNGTKTEFTLPSCRQAIEWLKQAAE